MTAPAVFFEKLYKTSPVPVAIFKDCSLLCTAGPEPDLLGRLEFERALDLLPSRFYSEMENCAGNMAIRTFRWDLLNRKTVFYMTPYLYNEQVYVVAAIYEEKPEPEFDWIQVRRLLHTCYGALNRHLDQVYGCAELSGLGSEDYKILGDNVRQIMRMANHIHRLMGGEPVEFYTIPVEMGSFVESNVRAFKEIYPEANIEVESWGPLAYVRIMPDDMEQVFSSLLSNGVRFCTSKVTVQVFLEQGTVHLIVKDDGRGIIDPSRLKEWGFAAPDSRGRTGLGSSLVLAKKLLSRWGATLEYERSGNETLFHIRMQSVDPPRHGQLLEWRAEKQEDMLSRMRVETSDLYYLNSVAKERKNKK